MSTHTSSKEAVFDLFRQYVIPNYVRYPVDLVRGVGSQIWDSEGNEYLDLFPGWGCNLLGHCPKRVVEAVTEQVATLIRVPNTWHFESQGRWAKMLSERSFGGQAFFCNSGAEANEAAIKEENTRRRTPGGLNPGWANGNFVAECNVPLHRTADGFRCGCGGPGASDTNAVPEPTEEEYNGACAEATRALEDAVVGINEALREIREIQADM